MQKPSEILSKALFTCSSPDLHNCPSDEGAEVAFAGRSNAGKSSAINCICDQAKLARTSKTPGRTQQINFFELDTEYRLVDLPGYGYAKVPEKVKIEWQKNMQDYFENRSSLKGIILVMDVRHPLKPFDEMMLEWANHYQMPIHILLTKADKLKSGASKQSLQKVRSQICEKYPEGAFSLQLFSALKQTNVEAARKQIMTFLNSG